MPVLQVPESVRTYYEDKAVRAAVDALVGNLNSKNAPAFNWSEARDYNQAILMAAKVRADYVELLHVLWEVTWGHAQASRLGSEDTEQSYWVPDDVWDDRILSRVFGHPPAAKKSAAWECPYVKLEAEEGFHLGLYRWNGDDKMIELSELAAAIGWRPVLDEEDDPTAITEAIPLRKFLNEPEVELPHLQQAATEMVNALLTK